MWNAKPLLRLIRGKITRFTPRELATWTRLFSSTLETTSGASRWLLYDAARRS